jgi:hypothetical protein
MATITEYTDYRVPGFLSNRPNWVLPPPHPQGSVAPTHFGTKGGDTRKGQTLWYYNPSTATVYALFSIVIHTSAFFCLYRMDT